MNQFILALCGLPASGKSTLAEAIKARVGPSVSIVRTDDWRDNAYYTEWSPEKEGVVRESALGRVRELARQGKSIIHDDTNYYNSMRHELLDIAVEHKSVFGVVYISTPLETALQWNRKREGTPVTNDMITKIHERFDTPGGRYLWDYPLAEVDMSKEDPNQVAAAIMEILKDLGPQRAPRATRLTPSSGDLLDQVTRDVVSEFLMEHPQHRRNKDVFLIRRSVLRRSIEEGLPPRGAGKLLRTELKKLL